MAIIKKSPKKINTEIKSKKKKNNYSAAFNQIRYDMKVEAVTTAKFYLNNVWKT